ncbi:hypothetical protein [Janibacter terrae]|uniref:hypothetical protein n=1 Tax=Janibacter terrae TaxID=103817 RepID=UPI0031F7376A
MSDAKTRQRWEARRKEIADDFFAGDEANAETVLDCLPYSAIPDWGDVALLMQSMDAAGLLATPEHDAAVSARAWDEGVLVGYEDRIRDEEDPLPAGELHDTPNPYEREGGAS